MNLLNEYVEQIGIGTYVVKDLKGFNLALDDYTYELYAKDAKESLSDTPSIFPCLVHFNFLEMPYPQIDVFDMPIKDLKAIVEKFG